jgi:signal transduction histidine kinase
VVQILVDFTRPRDLHLEDVDLRKILESVAALAAPDAARHGVRLVQQLPSQQLAKPELSNRELSNRELSRQELPNEDVPHGDDALMVRADSDLMKQAILNLVINGVQAMTAGGTLTLKARRDGETILAEVLDQGCGIPPEAQEKIFELYFTTKGGEGGSGIGLAQTYQIMQWHYGSVEFDSIVGAGTTFRLRLPAAAAKPESREEITA